MDFLKKNWMWIALVVVVVVVGLNVAQRKFPAVKKIVDPQV